MLKYESYKKAKTQRKEAQAVLDLIGRPQRTTSDAIGRLQTVKVSATIHHQETDGSKNYHTSKDLDLALSLAVEDHFSMLCTCAMNKLVESEMAALVEAEDEVKEIMNQIGEAKNPDLLQQTVTEGEKT